MKKTFGQYLRLARVQAGLSVPDMAQRLGISQATAYNWELRNDPPSPKYYEKLIELFGSGFSKRIENYGKINLVADVVELESPAPHHELGFEAHGGLGVVKQHLRRCARHDHPDDPEAELEAYAAMLADLLVARDVIVSNIVGAPAPAGAGRPTAQSGQRFDEDDIPIGHAKKKEISA